MKTFQFAAATSALTLVLFTGCDKKPPAPVASTNTTSSTSSPLTAPVDYLGALGKGQQLAVKTVDTASIDRAIQMFSVEEGRLPKDLNELVTEKFLPRIPDAPYGMKIVYDANAGTVRVVKQ
jgi:hypothetical protein